VRVSAAEKLELIRLVEGSQLSVRQTLREIGLPRSTFYSWYQRYLEGGSEALCDRKPRPRRVWNRIPDRVRAQVIETALVHTELSPRELACRMTDRESEFLSESSVYRILKAADLIESPAYILLQAGDRFEHPTRRRNELWQTDFTYLPVVGWGWYFLSTVLDDYSRKILAWKLGPTMRVDDVTETLDLARAATGVDRVRVAHKPRLLSDNGPCYLAKELKAYIKQHELGHTRGRPYHPMTQGKIERYHRSMKNVVRLENYYNPWELERAVARFVNYYNHERLHEAIGNVTPDDMYHGRQREILTNREKIKCLTLQRRKKENLRNAA
jgi:putative transposase